MISRLMSFFNGARHDRVLLRDKRVDQGGIFDGTVGWDDGQDHFDIDDDSGVTLVKVTLFHGRNPDTEGEKPADTRARGHQILCRIDARLNDIPLDGAQVLVAMAAGRMLVAGGGVIFSVVGRNAENQFSSTKAKLDFGPDKDLVLKARSITLTDYEDRYLVLGPDFGFKVGDADGNGLNLFESKWLAWTAEDGTATATLQLSKADGVKLMITDAGGLTALSLQNGQFISCGTTFMAKFAAGYLGAAPSALTPIAYAAGGTGVSPSWYVSLV